MAKQLGSASELRVTDYRQLRKMLTKMDLSKAMKANIRSDIQPMVTSVKSKIPSKAPLSHMAQRVNKIGRLRWGGVKPAKSVLLDMKPPSRKSRAKSLIKLVVSSPGTTMADMAGKSRKYLNSKPLAKGYGSGAGMVTSGIHKGVMGYPYTFYNPKTGERHRGFRAHRINKQGNRMIQALNGKGRPSRFVWKGAEAAQDSVQKKLTATLDFYINKVNEELKSNG